MPKINNELIVLLILAQRQKSGEWVTVNDIASVLEVTPRQARRYLDDLLNTKELFMSTHRGPKGGYRLEKELDPKLLLPENLSIMLAMASNKNEGINITAAKVTNKIVFDCITGTNYFRESEKLQIIRKIVDAILDNKAVLFSYKDFKNKLEVCPYKVIVNNSTCYLRGTYNGGLRYYDINEIREVDIGDKFEYDKEIEKKIDEALKYYGISDSENEYTLKVQYDKDAKWSIEKYFEGKGIFYGDNIFEIKTHDVHQLFYPLFRIGAGKYKILNEDIKKEYIEYLKKQKEALEDE